jgi:DNA repair protein RadD
MLTPFPHQEKATKATFDFFEEHPDGNPLIVVPVGGGKSLLIAEFIKRAISMYSNTNFIVLSHVAKLVKQDAEHLLGQWPEAAISFYCDKLKQKSFAGQTIFATIHSIYKQAYNIPKRIDIIMVDEAHIVSPEDATMYRKFIGDLLKINPYLKVIGYTGTDFRATEGKLTEGENKLFTDVAFRIPMIYLIEKGFLCPLVTPKEGIKTRMSTAGVKSRGGDYIDSQLQKAVDVDHITIACVDEIVYHGAKRNKWLIFTAGIDHCRNVRDEIRSRGISCEMLTSEDDDNEEELYKAYERGDFKCLVTVGKATTGVNIPAIDLIAFMRPTRSPVLYVQMGGRGMRLFPGKFDCLLLDFGGVIDELGPIDLVDAKKMLRKGDGQAPTKTCPQCQSTCFAGVRECLDCGYQFPEAPLAITEQASQGAAMSTQIEPEWYNVLSVNYTKHEKAGKPPSMCVVYNTLSGQFREWVGYEAFYTREKAFKWHKQRSELPPPRKVDEALKMTFKRPKRVLVRKAGKYFEITDYDFG